MIENRYVLLWFMGAPSPEPALIVVPALAERWWLCGAPKAVFILNLLLPACSGRIMARNYGRNRYVATMVI